MKWMWSTAIIIAAASAAVGAQSGKEMDKPMMGDKTNVMYTGCVESVNHGGTYLLTHVADDHRMAMGHDGMTKKDSAMAVKNGSAESSDMHGDRMMSSVVLAGSSDLQKHAGQKVTVTGSVSKGTLTVGSLKIVAKACK